jgi:hypothetical protein
MDCSLEPVNCLISAFCLKTTKRRRENLAQNRTERIKPDTLHKLIHRLALWTVEKKDYEQVVMILPCSRCVTLDGVLDSILDSLTTSRHDSEPQAITATSLMSTIQKKPAKFFQPAVFTNRSLTTASNSDDTSASRAQVHSERRLRSICLFSSQTVILITPLHGPSRKYRVQRYLYRCMGIRCRGNVFAEPLPRNECCFGALR